YTASCTISPAASGSLSNTATVTAPGGVTDPAPGNNSATDNDTLSLGADLTISKAAGASTVAPGSAVTYTIVTSNEGPSDASGVTVTDTFPAACASVTYSSVASGGAAGNTASGSGNISDTVNLPSGSGVTYTAICTTSNLASGPITNTAAIGTPTGVTDPNPSNNTSSVTVFAQAAIPIPTLSELALALLAAMMAWVALRRLRA
ncbi:MAG: DUF11 domain-containing protein, partial [Acidobacteriota bacterium]